MPLNDADKVTIIQSLQAIVAAANRILDRAAQDINDATLLKSEANKIMNDIRD